MKEKIQVDKVFHEFSVYGILLYLFASIIFSSMILNLILDMAGLNYISISSGSITIITWISKWIISIITIIIVFFLMLKAININLIARIPATNRFSIFSILWFIFNLMAQIFYCFYWTSSFTINSFSGSAFFNWSMFIIALLAIIFQLNVLNSLRSFFIVNDYGFSTKHCKKIRNSLIFLIIASVLMLYSFTYFIIFNQIFSIPTGNTCPYQLDLSIFVIFDMIIDILLIFGYSLLAYRFRRLKITADVSMNHNIDMQKKTQVDQIKQKFHGYGILLFIFSLVIVIQTPYDFFFNYDLISIDYYSGSLAHSIIILIFFILGSIIGIIILLLLMIKAIKINNITRKPAASRFATFSILWFIFYVSKQILLVIVLIIPIQNNNVSDIIGYILFAIILLIIIFQLNVWVSLRTFIMEKGNSFPSNSNKVIENSLLILIIALSVLLFSMIYYTHPIGIIIGLCHGSIGGVIYSWEIWWKVYKGVAFVSPDILCIIGYILLGYRLIKLKNSPHVPTYERNKL